MLFVVDEQNRPLDPRPRAEVHAAGYWHRNSHVWIFNSSGEILCQQRSLLKDTSPGLWDPFSGGHVLAGEGYLDTAIKECAEELGLVINAKDLRFFKTFKENSGKEFVSVFKLLWDSDVKKINFEKEEISQLKWIGVEKLKEILLVRKDPQWTEHEYEREALDWLTN
jgi:isopentenyldiphosphate isomerase